MSGGLFVKDNRAPVIVDIFYSMQWFLLSLAVCVTISYAAMEHPFEFCIGLLPAAAAFAAVALAVRLTDIIAIRATVPLLAIVGCILLGNNTYERILCGAVGAAAAVCGLVIHFRARKDSPQYNDMLFLSLPLALLTVFTWRNGQHSASQWLSMIAVVYLPLCIAVWFINRLSNSLSVFSNQVGQPIRHIRKRMSGILLTAVMIVLLISLLLPQSNGSSLLTIVLKTGLAVIIWLFTFIVSHLPNCSISPGSPPNLIGDSYYSAQYSEGSMWEIYLLYFAAAVMFISLVVWAVKSLIRIIRHIIEGFLRQNDAQTRTRISGYDTIEKLEPPQKKAMDIFAGRSNAQKVRHIYKKRIGALLGSRTDLGSLTPSEIAALCSEKGEDVTQLTELYKKARYTKSCTAEDVNFARRLKL